MFVDGPKSRQQFSVETRLQAASELAKFVQAESSGSTRRFERGETILSEGDDVSGLFLILQGIGKVTRESKRGARCTVGLAKAGDILGLKEVLDCSRHGARIIALGDVRALFVERDAFLALVDKNSDACVYIFNVLCRQINRVESKVMDIASKSALERVAYSILWLDEAVGRDANNALNIRLENTEIASLSYTAEATVQKILRDLQKSKCINRYGSRIYINDILLLQQFAGEERQDD